MVNEKQIINNGKALIQAGDAKQAAEVLEEVTREFTDSYAAFVHLAVAYSLQGRHNRAIGALKRASEIKPYSVRAHYNLAQAYEAGGVPKEAWLEYRTALGLDPAYQPARDAMTSLSHRLPELLDTSIRIEGDEK